MTKVLNNRVLQGWLTKVSDHININNQQYQEFVRKLSNDSSLVFSVYDDAIFISDMRLKSIYDSIDNELKVFLDEINWQPLSSEGLKLLGITDDVCFITKSPTGILINDREIHNNRLW
jgi:hypothetical protein